MADRRNTELGHFLRTRRAQVNPALTGLPDTPRRRVAGLRREELAQLAGLSADYYARLEQGRQVTASASVLDALAATLRLSPEERSHLYGLARAVDCKRPLSDGVGALNRTSGATSAQPRTAALPPTVQAMFDAFGTTSVIACGPFADIVAANPAARFLYADFDAMPPGDRNTIVWMLLDPVARELYGAAWQGTATEMIGKLRLDAGRYPDHPRAAELVARLDAESALFREVWQRHEISTCAQGAKHLHHRAGTLSFVSEAVTALSEADIVFYLMIPSNPASFAELLDRHAP